MKKLEKEIDRCSFFPEKWLTWKGNIISIKEICRKHDNEPKEGEEFEGCSNTGFYKDTWNSRLVGAVLIASVASIACWVKYFSKQKERV